MSDVSSAPLHSAVDAYIAAPTGENRDNLNTAADEYRELWIVAQASGPASKRGPSHRTPPTTYDRKFEVERVVEGISVKLALQEREQKQRGEKHWTLSWRSKYSPNGTNRKFYYTKDDFWMVPAAIALEMIEEMKERGGLDAKEYPDPRPGPIETRVSTEMTPAEKLVALAQLTGPDEDMGSDPFFVIVSDPNDKWKKAMIVDTDTDTATFRSITEDPDYMPKKVLRPGEGWWLDNSMMDANVQQTRAIYAHLRDYLGAAPTEPRQFTLADCLEGIPMKRGAKEKPEPELSGSGSRR